MATRTRADRSALVRLMSLAAIVLPGVVGGVAESAEADAGAQEWVTRHDGPAHSFDRAAAVAVGGDGTTVFVTGTSAGSGDGVWATNDFATVAYDAATGGELWAQRYDGPGGGYDAPNALAVSPDGSSVVVTGKSRGAARSLDYATVAYDASTGARLWVRRYAGDDRDAAHDLGFSPDGATVFVTGQSEGAARNARFATLAYDAPTGARLWTATYDGPDGRRDSANALDVSPDGTVFVTGLSTGSTTGYDFVTLAYDGASGAELWERRAGRFDVPHDLALSPDGSTVIVTGHSNDPTSDTYDVATVAYDGTTGARRWAARYDGPAGGRDEAAAVEVSSDGSAAFVTGTSAGSTTGLDYVTLGYEASTGERLWARRYDGPRSGDDVASGVGVHPDGSEIYVTGSSRGSTTGGDYASLAYDAATGSRLWVERFTGPGTRPDWAAGLAIKPDGSHVFVSGTSSRTQLDQDYATIAYTTS